MRLSAVSKKPQRVLNFDSRQRVFPRSGGVDRRFLPLFSRVSRAKTTNTEKSHRKAPKKSEPVNATVASLEEHTLRTHPPRLFSSALLGGIAPRGSQHLTRTYGATAVESRRGHTQGQHGGIRSERCRGLLSVCFNETFPLRTDPPNERILLCDRIRISPGPAFWLFHNTRSNRWNFRLGTAPGPAGRDQRRLRALRRLGLATYRGLFAASEKRPIGS